MRQLHFAGITDDHRELILADGPDADAERYSIPLDEGLLRALGELLPGRERASVPGGAARPRSAPDALGGPGVGGAPGVRDHRPTFPGNRPSFGTLSPREIQARLRAGRSVADVAREAGADDTWVERFAAPIVAEKEAAVVRARQMVVQTMRRGASARPLGESVHRNLLDKGIRLVEGDPTMSWSAFRQDSREWVVRFTYRYRGRDVEAEWLADLHAGSLVALNRAASVLGYVAPRPAGRGPGATVTPPERRRAERRLPAPASDSKVTVPRPAVDGPPAAKRPAPAVEAPAPAEAELLLLPDPNGPAPAVEAPAPAEAESLPLPDPKGPAPAVEEPGRAEGAGVSTVAAPEGPAPAAATGSGPADVEGPASAVDAPPASAVDAPPASAVDAPLASAVDGPPALLEDPSPPAAEADGAPPLF